MSAVDEKNYVVLPRDKGEQDCEDMFHAQEYPKNGVYCNMTWDRISCWPTTPGGSLAILSCPSILNDVKYDASKNVSRFCSDEGHWNNYSDYRACQPLADPSNPDETVDATSLIYYTGYAVSLVALTIALWIFLYFKDLRCMRNTFHANLMITYVLVDLTWIIYASLQAHTSPKGTCVVMVFLHYFQGTNFFWMFVEGFYLYMLVVRTFTVDKVKCKVYLFLGWGIPAIVVVVWAIVKQIFTKVEKADGCAWLQHDEYDWIFMGPLLFVLIINLLFLGKIMWVLITKLRATTAESQQYRKAAKALLVLIPLLGVTYILVMVAPREGTASVIINYLRAFLLSTQGLTVSILYCFLNGEVKNTLRHHIERWKESHSFGNRTRYSCRYTRDDSPRSGTESIRLYSAVHTDCRCEPTPRESCVSCLTTHSYVGNGHSKGANNDTNAKFSEGSSSNPIRENVAQTAPIKCN